jgi:hypothetical protein
VSGDAPSAGHAGAPPTAVSELPDPDDLGWPTAPDGDAGSARTVLEGRVAARKARIEAAISRAKAKADADIAQNADFQKALIEIAKGVLDRARTGADTVQKTAGTIGTLYAAVLAVSFSVADRPLPARGVLPAFFLGIALVLAASYLAFLNRKDPQGGVRTSGRWPGGLDGQFQRVTFLLAWSRVSARRRAPLMQSALVALGIGVILLPIAFVSVPASLVRASPSTVAVTPTPWPSPPVGMSEDLGTVLYGAQVKEVADQRAQVLAAKTPVDDGPFILVVALIGLLLVAVPLLRAAVEQARQKRSNAAGQPAPRPGNAPDPP